MRYIQKSPAPVGFEAWKKANNPTAWSALQNEPKRREEGIVYYSKKELRSELLTEQKHLCCYCQKIIENTITTVIEHLFPRNGEDKAQGKAKMFDYENLMAACDGGSDENRERKAATKSYPQYCDKHKDEDLLPLSPLQPDVESRLTYLQIGLDEIIISPVSEDDSEAKRAIEILNLNTPKLKNLRGNAIKGEIFQGDELISIEAASSRLAQFEQMANDVLNPHLEEFFGVKMHFLRLLSGRH